MPNLKGQIKETTFKFSSLEECYKKAIQLILKEDDIELRKELKASRPNDFQSDRFNIKLEDVLQLSAKWNVKKSRVVQKSLEKAGPVTVGVETKTRVIRVDWGDPDTTGGVHGLHVNVGTKQWKYALCVGDEISVGPNEETLFKAHIKELRGLRDAEEIMRMFASMAGLS